MILKKMEYFHLMVPIKLINLLDIEQSRTRSNDEDKLISKTVNR